MHKDEQKILTKRLTTRVDIIVHGGANAGRKIAHFSQDHGSNSDRGSHEPNLLKTNDLQSGYEDREATPPNHHVTAPQHREEDNSRRFHPPPCVKAIAHPPTDTKRPQKALPARSSGHRPMLALQNVPQLDAHATVRERAILVLQNADWQHSIGADAAHRQCSSRASPIEIRPQR